MLMYTFEQERKSLNHPKQIVNNMKSKFASSNLLRSRDMNMIRNKTSRLLNPALKSRKTSSKKPQKSLSRGKWGGLVGNFCQTPRLARLLKKTYEASPSLSRVSKSNSKSQRSLKSRTKKALKSLALSYFSFSLPYSSIIPLIFFIYFLKSPFKFRNFQPIYNPFQTIYTQTEYHISKIKKLSTLSPQYNFSTYQIHPFQYDILKIG